MDDIEQQVDDLLERLEKVLTPDDMSLLRYACGKVKPSKDLLTSVFSDFENIFGENKK